MRPGCFSSVSFGCLALPPFRSPAQRWQPCKRVLWAVGRYGNITATQVVRAAVTVTDKVQSGDVLNLTVTLMDGARDPKNLPPLRATLAQPWSSSECVAQGG